MSATDGGVATASAMMARTSRVAASHWSPTGVSETNVAELVHRTGVREVHASLRGIQGTRMTVRPPSVSLGAAPDWPADAIPVADSARVAQVKALLG